MVYRLIPIVLFALADAPSAPPPAAPPTEESFRTDAAPRIDPVFGDVAELRASIDRFLSLQGEMDRVRDEFSSAVHETLAALADEPPGPRAATDARQCPAATGAPYARALASGGRYLALGPQLQAANPEIRRAEDLGDTLGLTPDYRLRAKKAKDMHQQLLSDYREMRVAFYDQLGTELRHAGCKLTAKGIAASPPPGANPSSSLEPSEGSRPPNILSSWDLAEPSGELTVSAERGAPAASPPTTTPRLAAASPPLSDDAAAAGVAPAVWIEIDNALCNEPTRLAIDGQAVGQIGPRNKTSVRARSGPHEVCALPASDHRSCGDAGTLRKAYLHEGWRLTIHCAK
jgi:hypothetical protein